MSGKGKEGRVPQIRFAGFTDPWEQRKFSDLVEVCSGRDYKHLHEGAVPVYGTGGYMTSVDEALSYDKDAIGIGRKGTIDKPYRLRAPFWTVDTLFYCIPYPGIDINFALCCFSNVDWKNKDESTGLPSLSKEAINEAFVCLPSADEQIAIGHHFTNLDNLITLHQHKYDKLCEVKKSMLDKMFPKGGSLYPEIRFAGFTDPWEQRKLGELFEESDQRSATEEILSVSVANGIYPAAESDRETNPGASIANYKVVRVGDIVYNSMRMWQGAVDSSKYNGIVSPAYVVARPYEKLDSACFGYLLKRPSMLYKYLCDSQGNSKDTQTLKYERFAEIEAEIPPTVEEQKAISDYMGNLDSLITLHQRKLELLRNIKRAMLDKMFA